MLDLRQGYQQMVIAEDSKKYTAMSTPFGIFEWNRVPLGIKTAPAAFQNMMMDMFSDMDCVECYLDNIIVKSDNNEEHFKDLRAIFDRLKEFNSKLNGIKCEVFQKELKLLGYIIDGDGWRIDKEYKKKILNITQPKNMKEVQRFLGLIQFVSDFIPNLQIIAEPLTKLKRKGIKFSWGKEQQDSFERLKLLVENVNYLAFPDLNGNFVIKADACGTGLGSTLFQIQGKKETLVPISHYSKLFTKSQRNWDLWKRELYSLIVSLEKWRSLVIGSTTTLLNDHENLLYLMNKKRPTPLEARWRSRYCEYNTRIGHISGLENQVADYLSRSVKDNVNNVYLINDMLDSYKNISINNLELLTPICGECNRNMTLVNIDNVYRGGGNCDECDEELEYGKGLHIFHCDNPVHECGYDYCKKCGLNRIKEGLDDEKLNERYLARDKNAKDDKVDKASKALDPSNVKAKEIKISKKDKIEISNLLKDYSINNNPVSLEEIISAQKEDLICKIIRNCLLENSDENLTLLNDLPNKYISYYKNNKFIVKDDILLFKNGKFRIVIPKDLRSKVLHFYHDKIIHHGTNKLVDIISKKYFWVGYYADCRGFIKHCFSCNSNKGGIRHRAKIKPLYSEGFNDLISIDFKGPIVKSNSNNRYLIVVQDHFTKYIKMIPVKNIKTETVLEGLINNWFYVYGLPNKILSDNGTQFTSKLYDLIISTFGVRMLFTPPYHPQANGSNERTHSYIDNPYSSRQIAK